MNNRQQEQFEKLVSYQKQLTGEFTDYWNMYSDISAWQFWVVLLLLIVPVIVLYFVLDRKLIFVVCFFGFATHVLFAYVEIVGLRSGLWGYPYHLFPYIPSISLDASIIPIGAMLVFQWTLKNNKNFYLYGIITAVVFGFGLKPLLMKFDLFQMYKWVNFPLVFLLYVVLFYLAYLLTKFFMKMQKEST